MCFVSPTCPRPESRARATMPLCQVDADCPGPTVCMVNITWYLNSPSVTFDLCDCSTFYGLAGAPNCLQRMPTAIWWISSAAILMIMSFSFALFSFYVLFTLCRGGQFLKFNAWTVTIIQVCISLCLFGVYETIRMVEPMNAPIYITAISKSTGFKIANMTPIRESLFAVGLIFSLNATMSLAFVWMDMALRAKSFSMEKTRFVSKAQLLAAGFEIFFLVLIIIFISMELFTFALVTIIPVILGVVATYYVGFSMFRKEIGIMVIKNSNSGVGNIGGSSSNGENKDKVLLAVINDAKRTAVLIVCAQAFIIICGVTYFFYLTGNDKVISNEGLHPQAVTRQVLHFAIIFQDCCTLFSVHKMVMRSRKSKLTSSNVGSSKSNNNTGGKAGDALNAIAPGSTVMNSGALVSSQVSPLA